jgi:threonyl-tRNA synthetase
VEAFGFADFKAYLATRPEKGRGEEARWDEAIGGAEARLEAEGLPYEMDEGGGAFYGPKIDLKLRDALGREWQTTTIQFDFNLPERFDLTYVGADGQEHRPYMVHRALLGSLERFFRHPDRALWRGVPAWLAPVQAQLIPIADRHNGLCPRGGGRAQRRGRARGGGRLGDRMQAKIRAAQLQKVPYMLVIGDREVENHLIARIQAAVAEKRDCRARLRTIPCAQPGCDAPGPLAVSPRYISCPLFDP